MKLKRLELDDDVTSSQDEIISSLDNTLNDDNFNQPDMDSFAPDSFGDDFSNAGMAPYEKHNDLLKNIMDFESYIKQLVNGWLGLVWSESENKFVKDPDQKAIMNKKCAAWCSNTLRTYARANNVITTINAIIYDEIMSDVGRTVIINIRSRAEEFGIDNQGDATTIKDQMINTVKLMLSGLGNGKMAEVLKTTVNRNENVVLNENPQPQGDYAPRQTAKGKGMIGFMNKWING